MRKALQPFPPPALLLSSAIPDPQEGPQASPHLQPLEQHCFFQTQARFPHHLTSSLFLFLCFETCLPCAVLAGQEHQI